MTIEQDKKPIYKQWWFIIVAVIAVVSVSSSIGDSKEKAQSVAQTTTPAVTSETVETGSIQAKPTTKPSPVSQTQVKTFEVTKVVDGDTLDISIDGKIERLRLIGINTPETVDPRKTVECFGVEASNKAKSILTGKKVFLESDSSQGELDKYGRLLRYVFLEDGTNFNLLMIKDGYAYEYTYSLPYKYQAEFKQAQKDASQRKAGLWGDICQQETAQPVALVATSTTQTSSATSSCTIKGNISSSGERIYHMTGCGSYNKTVINETQSEKWFCSEQEATSAGWRKALNCN